MLDAEASRCLLRLQGSQASVQPRHRHAAFSSHARPILLTYLDRIPPQWLLARSAAHHGLPLAVAGVGRTFSFADKLMSTERAVAMIHRLNPKAPIIFADGSDTLVANPITARVQTLLRLCVEDGRVSLGAECHSYPVCYIAAYRNHSAHARCRESGSPTCFVNSGLYAGGSGALLRLLSKAREAAREGRGVERDDDQAAMHQLLLKDSSMMEV